MRETFPAALEALLRHEGGYVNHPDDPGGHTNLGITLATLTSWRRRQGKPDPTVQALKSLSRDEAAQIYRWQYWDMIKGDSLPSGLDYAVFDFAVNSGPARAARFLQKIVGASADGVIGVNTLAALDGAGSPSFVIAKLCEDRLVWLKTLRHWSQFGRGWSRRVEEVCATAKAMAGGTAIPAPATTAPSTRVPSTRDAKVRAGKTPEGKGLTIAGAGSLGAMLSEAARRLEHFAAVSDIALALFVLLTAAGIGFTVWKALQRAQREQEL